MDFETLIVRKDGAILFVDIAAPPMNLLGPALVRNLVSLIAQAEADSAIKVLVFKSVDPDYFIPHVGSSVIFFSSGFSICMMSSPPSGAVPTSNILRTSEGRCSAISWATMPPRE
jgi:hypothetical protein